MESLRKVLRDSPLLSKLDIVRDELFSAFQTAFSHATVNRAILGGEGKLTAMRYPDILHHFCEAAARRQLRSFVVL
jgi:hypothetical protein